MRSIIDLTVTELLEISRFLKGKSLGDIINASAKELKTKYDLENQSAGQALGLILCKSNSVNFLKNVSSQHGPDFKFSQVSIHTFDTSSPELCLEIAEFSRTLCIRMREIEALYSKKDLTQQ